MRRFRASRALCSLAMAAAVGTLSACSAGHTAVVDTTQAGSDTAPSALTVASTSAATSLDFTTTGGAAIPAVLMDNVYETLVTVDPESGEIVDALAESHEVSEDRLTYTFTLPTDRTFSDGSELTAGDFVRRCKQIVDLLDQVAKASQDERMRTTARKAIDGVMRGVVAADRID